ncbi:Isotrichodermin C-15 hydroxylase 12 [Colletotrichum chlorophyti]|uniref:Isotrichodermin C-15 hydroxylase 12 n=1 Tax=Colletotrichum chlorophyti TaxID=708187 RepID=A0A1Q8RJ38_9PEZI|nr:Isotrichodermin C-15 hydroxylase 12 [Colletotrichum chlorophyti]
MGVFLVTASLLGYSLLLPVVGVAYIAVVIIYRLWFHPLARFPGPWLGKITNLYSAYYAWTGDLHIDMWRCHEKHAIYGFSRDLQKATTYNVMVHRAPSTLTMTDKRRHALHRRIVSQGFSSTALRQYESTIKVHIEKLAKHLAPSQADVGAEWSKPQNMSDWANRLSFDVISDVVFEAKYDMIGKPDNRHILECIDGANVRTSVLFQAAELTIGRLDRRLFPRSIEARNKFIPFISYLVKTRLRNAAAKTNDVFSLLVDAKDPETGEGLDMNSIGGESTTLLMAGSDTTSTAIAATFFYLSRNRHIYEKVKSELNEAFSDAEEICLGPALNACVYLRACIDESLRMSPPVGGAPWREVLSRDMVVDGRPIPAGCDVGTSIYALHHNPAYFPDPFVYRPERWLGNGDTAGSKQDVRLAQSAFAAFSIGPRSCVGKGLAIAELMLTLATLFRKYDIKTAEGSWSSCTPRAVAGRNWATEFQLFDHITSAKDGPYVSFRKSRC